jgi:hypothetical protein
MKNKKLLIINVLIALLFLVISILFIAFLEINKPLGLILFILMLVISFAGLGWFSYYASAKKLVPETFVMLSVPTYVFQFIPIIMFFLCSDYFTNGVLVMVPVLFMLISVIIYVAITFSLIYYNQKAVESDEMTEAKSHKIEDEASYYNEDGSFKGL